MYISKKGNGEGDTIIANRSPYILQNIFLRRGQIDNFSISLTSNIKGKKLETIKMNVTVSLRLERLTEFWRD